MTRREFRHATSFPRPRSAVAMVALATLTLAITQQIQMWALLLAAILLVIGARPRASTTAWQKSPLFLNAGLAFTVSTGAFLWWQGQPVMIALAHFAMLTQGLQLLDMRPRKSEFLLVSLSVFQVTLAANLTDSALFPPLLVAFTITTVWTLVIHTLRAEAIECGEPEAVHRLLNKGLLRTTLVASLVSVLLSIALFPILPRIRSGSIFESSLGPAHAVSGFSDRVELGEIGRIRQDSSVVLRVETQRGPVLDPDQRYWRGLAFDHFDGRRWSVTPKTRYPIMGNPQIGIDLGGPRGGKQIVQHIIREGVQPGVLFSPGYPATLRGGLGRLERGINGSLHASATAGKRVIYVISSDIPMWSQEMLRSDSTALPFTQGERYLQLPRLNPEIRALAQTITESSASDYERVIALERWLRTEGRYTNQPPPFEEGSSPVEGFLLERTEGHCEYFASSMVVLARSLGIPARIVNGFASGAENSFSGFIEVAQSDAHTWVEVHFQKAGWVRFDPTPPDLRLAGSDAFRNSSHWRELASAMELWWFTNVVDFDRENQTRALRELWFSWHRWRQKQREPRSSELLAADPAETQHFSFEGSWPAIALLALSVLLLAGWHWKHRSKTGSDLPPEYKTALRWLKRRGYVRKPQQSARQFVDSLSGNLPVEAISYFSHITESYLAERFGDRKTPDLRDELQQLRHYLRS